MSEVATQTPDVLEELAPSTQVREVTLGTGDYERVYLQKPLSFFGKLELARILGEALDKAMAGEDGLSLADLWDMPERTEGQVTVQDIMDADNFVRGIMKLTSYAPDLIGELYCVALNIPRDRREQFKRLMELPEDEGGLSDEAGIGIFETFIDQNWDVLLDFFKNRLMPLFQKMGAKFEIPQSSKPSKSTRQSTRKESKSS